MMLWHHFAHTQERQRTAEALAEGPQQQWWLYRPHIDQPSSFLETLLSVLPTYSGIVNMLEMARNKPKVNPYVLSLLDIII